MSLSRDDIDSKRRIRAARVGSQGTHVVSATEGTELSITYRQRRMLQAFDGGPEVEVYSAEPTALLCANAFNLNDRMEPKQVEQNRPGSELKTSLISIDSC